MLISKYIFAVLLIV